MGHCLTSDCKSAETPNGVSAYPALRMLKLFEQAGSDDKKIAQYRFWQEGCYTEVISSLAFYKQKLNYIHQNPVRAEFVKAPQDYLYSSATDYAGGKGLLDVIVARGD